MRFHRNPFSILEKETRVDGGVYMPSTACLPPACVSACVARTGSAQAKKSGAVRHPIRISQLLFREWSV